MAKAAKKTPGRGGRKPAGSLAAEKIRLHREDMRRRGFKLVQFWAPDPEAPGFKEAVRATREFLEKYPDREWDEMVARTWATGPDWNDE